MKTWMERRRYVRGLAAAALLLALAGPVSAQGTGSGPTPGSSNAAPTQPAGASQVQPKPSASPAVPAKPSPAGESRLLDLLIAGLVAAVVSAAVAFGVLTLRGRKGTSPSASAPESTGGAAQWAEFESFRSDVLDVLKQMRNKAGSLDTVPKLTLQDWTKQLARARADLERAPLTRADYEPLRQLWVDVSKIGQEMSERAKRSPQGEDLAGSLFSFTQALSRRSQDAAKSESTGASSGGDAGALKGELRRLEEQVEKGNSGLAEQFKQLSQKVRQLEERPAPSLGSLVEEEFRVLCEARAAELERQLDGSQARAGSADPAPPVVPAALKVADAALRVSEEALRARGLDPSVKAQLTNLATLASTLQAMCPVAIDPGRPPSVEGIRRLPERPEARWQPEMVARGGSVLNAVTAYWSEVNRLLQAEAGRVEQWLSGSTPDRSARDAAVGEWLASRLLPLLDQAGSAVQEDSAARREAREGGSTALVAALDELLRACERVMHGTGLEARVARKGEVLRPQAGVKIDHADAGQSPDSVLEVRQIGWNWHGRLLRELHVLVQEEGAPSPPAEAPAPPLNGGFNDAGAFPRPDDGGPRVKRL